MYYEEKIINGRLCYRGSPTEPFAEFTVEELTIRIGLLKLMGTNASCNQGALNE